MHDAAPPPHVLGRLQALLWPTEAASPAATSWFAQRSHDELLQALLVAVDAALPGFVRASVFQSLQDAGCDIGIECIEEGAKYGIQVKSYGDIAQPEFARDTLAQIQDSRRHGLQRLFLLLAGDMTDPSQAQKVAGLHSRINQMADPYVIIVPPQRLRALIGPRSPEYRHPYIVPDGWGGREAEMDELDQWLAADSEPICCLVAMGGMGKSSLAWNWVKTRVEPTQEHSLLDGIFQWSFYEGEASFQGFLKRLLAYLRVIPASDPVTAIVEHLRTRRVLLILDGFERLLRYYACVDAVLREEKEAFELPDHERQCADPVAYRFLTNLAANSAAKTLVTTRLSPEELDNAAACHQLPLEGLAPEDAIAFLSARGIDGDDRELEAAARAYGFHPLSLEHLIVALRYDTEIPNDIRQAQKHAIDGDVKRKRQHILEQAYDTLPSWIAHLLSAMAATRGTVPMEVVRSVAKYCRVRTLGAGLQRLEADRWIQWHKGHGGNTIYFHPVVRRYAYGRLIDKADVHEHLRQYFAPVPVPNTPEVRSLDDLASVIEMYWHTASAGRYDEASHLYCKHLWHALYYRLGAYQTEVEMLSALFPDGEDAPPKLSSVTYQAWAMNSLAISCANMGQPRRAAALIRRHNALHEQRDSRLNLAIGLENLAQSLGPLGELGEAEQCLRRALQITTDVFWNAVGHEELGRVLAWQGAFEEAEESLKAAKVLLRWGAIQSQPGGMVYRAERALLMGRPIEALEAARRAREVADEHSRTDYPVERDFVRSEWILGWTLTALAGEEPSRRHKLLTEAEAHLNEGLTRCRRINNLEQEPRILLAWARWHRLAGHPEEARQNAAEALAISNRCEYRLNQADIHNLLALLDLEAGEIASAREHAAISMERAYCDGPPYYYKPAYEEAERLFRQIEEQEQS